MEGREPQRTGADPVTAENLKRLARVLDSGAPLSLRINGRRVTLPANGSVSVDLERDPETGCAEVDIRWSADPPPSRRRTGNSADGKQGGLKRTGSSDEKRPGPHVRLKAIVAPPRI